MCTSPYCTWQRHVAHRSPAGRTGAAASRACHGMQAAAHRHARWQQQGHLVHNLSALRALASRRRSGNHDAKLPRCRDHDLHTRQPLGVVQQCCQDWGPVNGPTAVCATWFRVPRLEPPAPAPRRCGARTHAPGGALTYSAAWLGGSLTEPLVEGERGAGWAAAWPHGCPPGGRWRLTVAGRDALHPRGCPGARRGVASRGGHVVAGAAQRGAQRRRGAQWGKKRAGRGVQRAAGAERRGAWNASLPDAAVRATGAGRWAARLHELGAHIPELSTARERARARAALEPDSVRGDTACSPSGSAWRRPMPTHACRLRRTHLSGCHLGALACVWRRIDAKVTLGQPGHAVSRRGPGRHRRRRSPPPPPPLQRGLQRSPPLRPLLSPPSLPLCLAMGPSPGASREGQSLPVSPR